jgi:hypothetical protein
MSTDDLQFYSIVGVVVSFCVLYLVIAAATRSKKRALYAWVQMELLAKIARAQGVDPAEIDATLQAAGLIPPAKQTEETSRNPNPTLK